MIKAWIAAATIALVGVSGMVWVVTLFERSPSKLHVSKADMANRMVGEAFRWWREQHPDVGIVVFPEIATSPVLWDFTEHAVLGGLKRTWSWDETTFTTTMGTTLPAMVVVGTSGTAISANGFGYAAVCSTTPGAYQSGFTSPAPAMSGGYP